MAAIAKYDTEQIERALWAVALNAGSVTKAARELEARGTPILKQTLHNWITGTHAHRYSQIQHEASDRISEKVASEAEAFLLESAETERLLLRKIHEAAEAGDLKPADISGAMRNVSTSRALANDKIIGPLRGRPTVIEHRHNTDELLRKLDSLRVRAVDSTATEVPTSRLIGDGDGLNARELPTSPDRT